MLSRFYAEALKSGERLKAATPASFQRIAGSLYIHIHLQPIMLHAALLV